MRDQAFTCYNTSAVYLGGAIRNGRLRIESNIYGDGDAYPYDVEAIYDFSEEMTDKLFGLITLDGFKKLCKEEMLLGMEQFLEENHIEYKKNTWWSD